jgi:nicotinate-nucleotide pyrophosphorylase (carboxylating)
VSPGPRRVRALAERGFEPTRGLRFPLARLLTASIVREALAEDAADQDLTTIATIVSDRRARGAIVAREAGVIAGIPLARETFRQRDPRASVRASVRDGQRVAARTPIIFVTSHARALLSAERVALNFMQHLSGIASLTAKYVDAVKGTGARILDTRKTTPGWRRLEKYAVRAGGGLNHRMHLASAVLIKDNHLSAVDGDVELAVRRARELAPAGMAIEVECDTLDHVRSALVAEVDVIMLDNMSLDQMRVAVELVRGRAVIEASGSITLDRVRAIAATGVNWISVGALTHSARALDLALDFE